MAKAGKEFDKIIGDRNVPEMVRETYSTLKQWMDDEHRQKWMKRRTDAWESAINNEMWSDEDKAAMKKTEQLPLVINKLNKGIQGSSAIVTDSKPEIKFYPVGSGDLYVAELLKRGHDYVWAQNEGNDVIYDAVEESKIGGLAFFDSKHDPSKGIYGRIVFEETPPDDVYFDPASRARSFSDTHLIKAKQRTKSYIREKYDDISDEDLVYGEALEKDPEESAGVTGEDNYTIGTDERQPTEEPEPENIWEIEAWWLKTVPEIWVMIPTQNGGYERRIFKRSEKKEAQALADTSTGIVWERKVEKRFLRIIVGKKIIKQKTEDGVEVDELENPHGVDSDGDPVVPLIGLKHQRTLNAFPMSPTMYAKDINREKNKRRSQFIYLVSQNANSPLVRTENSKWQGSPGTPGSELIVSKTDAFQPYRLQGGTLEATRFMELEQRADQDIDDQYDLHDVLRGKVPAGQDNIAGRTVLALQDMGGMMSKPYLRKLESALVRLAKVNVALMLKHWPRLMWERLIEPEEWQEWMPDEQKAKMQPGEQPNPEAIQNKWLEALERIRPGDPAQPPGISLLDMDVRIAAGSSMPTNRMAKMAVATDLVANGIYMPEDALEFIDDPNKDKIIKRRQANMEQMAIAELTKGGKK